MNTVNNAPGNMAARLGAISTVLNATRVLPTESVTGIQDELQELRDELGADTPLKVYLVENIHECLLWIRRYRLQKYNTILRKVASLLAQTQAAQASSLQSDALFEMLATAPVAPAIAEIIQATGTSMEALQDQAMNQSHDLQKNLDERIAVQMKMLQGFTTQYELIANRKLKREYLRLQVQSLSRDLNAITYDQSQTTTSQPS